MTLITIILGYAIQLIALVTLRLATTLLFQEEIVKIELVLTTTALLYFC